jgi:DNA-directed RNA polymerase sigma subunit (sigma70/sigma32)
MDNVVVFSPVALATVVGVPREDGESYWQAALRLREFVNELPSMERQVISWLFGLFGPDVSVREVANRMRLTPEAVVRIEERALDQLRRMCGTTSVFSEAA